MEEARARRIRELIEPFRVPPETEVVLERDFDPADTRDLFTDEDSREILDTGIELLDHYQARLAAQDTYGLLVVLQALDAGGKDSTIRHVMTGVNPQGVVVHGFRKPSADELDHDYLWRYVQKLPARGQIAIFNRSHYEEVIVVRVHPEILDGQKLPPGARENLWERRYRQINDWERFLVENGFPVVKLFLNLSYEEQRRRFLRRIDYPEANWKFNANDVKERARWADYQTAFSQMLSATSTEHAPWYVIPADHKWFLRVAVAAVLVSALAEIDPQYPSFGGVAHDALLAAKAELEAQAPEGVPADPIAGEIEAAGVKE